ncbi:MAG TPA: hypothetical protein VGP82_00990 [Ktedonobacterales bacterium]|nr:hypothetical protein [Ktedonobacterales bacterium]
MRRWLSLASILASGLFSRLGLFLGVLRRLALLELLDALRHFSFQLLEAFGTAALTVGALTPLVGGACLADGLVDGEGSLTHWGHREAREDHKGVQGSLGVADLHLFPASAVGLAFTVHEGASGQAGAEGLDELTGLEPGVELLLGRRIRAVTEADSTVIWRSSDAILSPTWRRCSMR